jgi:hypothetical protein
MKRLFLIALLFSMAYLSSCNFGTVHNTPKEFLNELKVDKAIYNNDKVAINTQFLNFLSTHDQSFYSKEFFDSTLLTIDTILYSEDKNRIAVFVFTKNPTTRQIANKKLSMVTAYNRRQLFVCWTCLET